MERLIAHCDADCFFAAVEIRDNPFLKRKPVLVCNRTDNRGIVVTASYEARPFGIRAGTPVYQAIQLCPKALLVETNFHRYSETSRALMELLRTLSPHVQPYSIDEAFVDLTGLPELLNSEACVQYAQMLQLRILNEIGIPVSIGIASSKLLAKIASDLNKPRGVAWINETNRRTILSKLPISAVPGVGRKTALRLSAYGYTTAADLASRSEIQQFMGSQGRYFYAELNGEALSPVASRTQPPKSLSHLRTFPIFTADHEYVLSYALQLLHELTERLRWHEQETAEIQLVLVTKDFSHRSATHRFETATASEHILIPTIKELFKEIVEPGKLYRKTGFIMSKLQPAFPKQYSLFNSEKEAKNDALNTTRDALEKRFGKHVMSLSRRSVDKSRKSTTMRPSTAPEELIKR